MHQNGGDSPDQLLQLGVVDVENLAQQLEVEHKSLHRVVLSALPRGKKFKPLVSEYGEYSSNRTWDAKRKRYELTFMFKLQGRKSACTTCAGSSEILRWLTPFLGPNMDPKMGSRIGSHFHSFF